MAEATRKIDLTSPPPGGSARIFDQASDNVLINNIGAVRASDSTKPPVSSVPPANASQTVFINGKNAVRKGDTLADTSSVAQGSSNVNIGD